MIDKQIRHITLCFALIFTSCNVFSDPLNSETPVATTIKINVGLSIRPPFLIGNHQQFFGAGPEILAALNKFQQTFHFVAVEIPSKRKQKALNDGLIDIMMWDNLNWGWREKPVQSTAPIVSSKDVYITYANKTKSQQYFETLKNKSLALVIGYHYKLTEFDIEISTLTEHYDATMVRTEEASIRMTAANRVDIAIVSETALNWFFKQYPTVKQLILVSNRIDTQYTRHFIVPNSASISVNELNQLLQRALDANVLQPIYRKYGLTPPSSFL
ncbi:substrate-binding periplasmic protein [Thalassotalea sediminis]|uniref:substrate-binding periplasmic protein n=1 Tax=Thalassotalea sediminis TaxID=1759089 RepID=UPI0025724823|nr:transporter substrate-binding domain-containing protein [Thalassotalea sediminis]